MAVTKHPNRSTLPVSRLVLAASLAVAFAAAGCGFTNNAEQQKAEQLVSAAHAAGVAPHLTVGVATALYGSDAPTVCKVFEDGLTTAERNDVLGNPSGRRPKTISSDAVTYGRAVVQTYCPAELAHYDNVVSELDAVKTERE